MSIVDKIATLKTVLTVVCKVIDIMAGCVDYIISAMEK